MVAGSWGFSEVQEAGDADLVQDACGGGREAGVLQSVSGPADRRQEERRGKDHSQGFHPSVHGGAIC